MDNFEDQAAFVEEFNKMIKVWKPEGYLSLGGIFGGQRIEGESHYIYTTYNTYEEMLQVLVLKLPKNKKHLKNSSKIQMQFLILLRVHIVL